MIHYFRGHPSSNRNTNLIMKTTEIKQNPQPRDILQTLWPALLKIVKVIKICPWEVEAGGAEVQDHLQQYGESEVILGHTRFCLKRIEKTKLI